MLPVLPRRPGAMLPFPLRSPRIAWVAMSARRKRARVTYAARFARDCVVGALQIAAEEAGGWHVESVTLDACEHLALSPLPAILFDPARMLGAPPDLAIAAPAGACMKVRLRRRPIGGPRLVLRIDRRQRYVRAIFSAVRWGRGGTPRCVVTIRETP